MVLALLHSRKIPPSPGWLACCPKCGCGACSDRVPTRRQEAVWLSNPVARTMAWTTVLRTLFSSLAADRTLPPLFSNRANAGDHGGSCAGYPHLSAGLALRRRAAVLSPRSLIQRRLGVGTQLYPWGVNFISRAVIWPSPKPRSVRLSTCLAFRRSYSRLQISSFLADKTCMPH